ncbi:MAG: RNA polymerase sigma factor [Verrucomicrobiota bacterium]|jgi:RNA polymerase sigma-70 factor (ECF subfamily)
MDEEQVISALRGQDPAAARELVDSYGQRLLRSAFLLCGNETEAQDLVQETFLQAWKSAHRFRGGAALYTWLHAILLNLTRHYHRDRKRLVSDPNLTEEEIPAPEEGPSRLDTDAASTALTDALGRLTAPHREVVVLRFYEDMKICQIAAHLGISKGTVKSRLHYAIAQLRDLLPGELNLFGVPGTKETENR